jgi:hypothetical protein
MGKQAPNFPGTLISGGQTGADRAGLDFALESGLKIKGFCPKGRRAYDGPLHKRYKLIETPSPEYPERTHLNAALADATAIFDAVLPSSSGTRLALRTLASRQKPHVILKNFPDKTADTAQLVAFLREHKPRTLNIAGNSEARTPGIYGHVKAVLRQAFDAVSLANAG